MEFNMAISRLGAIADALIDAIRATGREGTLTKAAAMKIPTPSSAVPLDSVRTFERRAAANPMIPESQNPLRTNVPGTPDKDDTDEDYSQRRKDEAYLPLRFAANFNCCPSCSERDGDYVSPGSSIIQISHPNCPMDDTPISFVSNSDKIVTIRRAPYLGDTVRITVGGVACEVTPYHPVLTGTGWKPAKFVTKSDYLIVSACNGNFMLGAEDTNNKVMSAKTFFDSILKLNTSPSFKVKVSSEYFDNQVSSGKKEVTVVNFTEPILIDELYSMFDKQLGKSNFVFRRISIVKSFLLKSLRVLKLKTLLSSLCGFMTRGGTSTTKRGVFDITKLVLLTDTSFKVPDEERDQFSAYTSNLMNSQYSFPGDVKSCDFSFKKVASVSTIKHNEPQFVYLIQTLSNVYFTHYLAHNCICQLLSEEEYQKRAKLMGSHFGTPSTAPASQRNGQNENQLNTDPTNPKSPRYDPTSRAWIQAADKLSPDEKIGYSNKRTLAAMLGDQAGRVNYAPSTESNYHLTDKPSEILRRGK